MMQLFLTAISDRICPRLIALWLAAVWAKWYFSWRWSKLSQHPSELFGWNFHRRYRLDEYLSLKTIIVGIFVILFSLLFTTYICISFTLQLATVAALFSFVRNFNCALIDECLMSIRYVLRSASVEAVEYISHRPTHRRKTNRIDDRIRTQHSLIQLIDHYNISKSTSLTWMIFQMGALVFGWMSVFVTQ